MIRVYTSFLFSFLSPFPPFFWFVNNLCLLFALFGKPISAHAIFMPVPHRGSMVWSVGLFWVQVVLYGGRETFYGEVKAYIMDGLA